MRSSIAVAGTVVVLSVLAACAREGVDGLKGDVEIPIRPIAKGATCDAEFEQGGQKQIRDRNPGARVRWVLSTGCPQGTILPTRFRIKPPNVDCAAGGGQPADDHFDVDPKEGGRTVTATLTKAAQENAPEPDPGNNQKRRAYCYSLELRVDGKPAGDIDPVIEFIWP
jgi:hypothetical protein